MAQKMLIDATHSEETRVVVVDGNRIEEFDFETASRRQLAGNIYLAKVTRVEPSLQAAFVDYGGNRHGFLAFNEIHPDYYQIPAADRKALLDEERALASDTEDDAAPAPKVQRSSNRRRKSAKAEEVVSDDARQTRDVAGMDIVEPEGDGDTRQSDDAAAPAADTASDTTVPAGDAPATREEPAQAEAGSAPKHPVPAETARNDTSSATVEDDASGDDEGERNGEEPYVAADHAAETDDQIESVADDDVTDEVRPRRKPRARRYKIQEVIKVRQIMLVQVVKEERGNKGAALTTYLSLAGRYCVLMPNTARGGGISRKITNAADRKKLKEIAGSIQVPEGAGLIIRTAGANRTKTEIKRDYEYLFRLWEQIRDLTLKSIAPAPIYEEGNLIKRSIRDLYSREIDEVLVEGADGYRTAKDFMKMIMPSHARNVKQYSDPLPLFARYQVEGYLAGMFNPTVQLPSGGYIVIGVTEALVAIDINSGKATREGSIEETALKTNLEAAAEIARQLRLRDLAGLIVIDFIDMEERKNNAAVEKMLKDKLKNDRARIQVGRISGFGLLEMSRQRLRPGMLEATTQPCPHCHGTGLIRSDDSLGLSILRQLEEEGTRGKSREVLVRAPVAIINFLFNQKREHIAQIEARYGLAVRLEADPQMVSPDFSIEKFRTATRMVSPQVSPVVSLETSQPIDDKPEEDAVAAVPATHVGTARDSDSDDGDDSGDGSGRKRRRRRRRRRGGQGGAADSDNGTEANGARSSDDWVDAADEPVAANAEPAQDRAEGADVPAEAPAAEVATAAGPNPPRGRNRKRSNKRSESEAAAPGADEVSAGAASQPGAEKGAPTEPESGAPAEAVLQEVEATEPSRPGPQADAAQPDVATPVSEAGADPAGEVAEAPATSGEGGDTAPLEGADPAAATPVASEPEPPAAQEDEVGQGAAGHASAPSDGIAISVPEQAGADAADAPPTAPEIEVDPAAMQSNGADNARAAEAEADESRAVPEPDAESGAQSEPRTQRRGWWNLGR